MPVNLSIKNVPDLAVERLRQRAERNHRSLQGELMAILEEAVQPVGKTKLADIATRLKKAGLRSPSESAAIIRKMRDGR